MKKHKGKIFAVLVVAVLLGVSFFISGDHDVSDLEELPAIAYDETVSVSSETVAVDEPLEKAEEEQIIDSEITARESHSIQIDEQVQDETPLPQATTCALSVDCISAYNNMNLLKSNKSDVVPESGIIYEARIVPFTEGESVFDVLQREMSNNGIHFEFVYTPMYESAYVEGINNLYEFDCGPRSGWMYRVNGVKTNVGTSLYKVKPGDNIRVYYTCNFSEER